MSKLFKRNVLITLFRMSSPKSTEFNPKPLSAGEQLEVTDLRVKFKIIRDFTKHPNNTSIDIYNLSPQSRADLQTKPLRVQIAAGYDGINRLMAVGDLFFGQSKQEGTDWVTLLQLTDGGRSYGFSRMNKSFARNSTYRQVLRDVARSMGVQLPPALEKNADLDRQLPTGAALVGPSRDELTRYLAPFGYDWSFQNGVLRVLQDNEVVNNGQFLLIGEEQGMIGTPEFGSPPHSGKPPHVTVKMLLYPELVPGDFVQLKSKAKSGNFKIIKVTHQGDTHGKDFETEIEIKPL